MKDAWLNIGYDNDRLLPYKQPEQIIQNLLLGKTRKNVLYILYSALLYSVPTKGLHEYFLQSYLSSYSFYLCCCCYFLACFTEICNSLVPFFISV